MPHSFFAGLCRASHRWSCFPTRDEAGIVALGLFGDSHLLMAQRLHAISIGRPTLVALSLRVAGLEMHVAGLVGDQRRAHPQIVLVLGQQMPAQNGKVTRHGDSGDLMADLADTAVMSGTQARLPYPRPRSQPRLSQPSDFPDPRAPTGSCRPDQRAGECRSPRSPSCRRFGRCPFRRRAAYMPPLDCR